MPLVASFAGEPERINNMETAKLFVCPPVHGPVTACSRPETSSPTPCGRYKAQKNNTIQSTTLGRTQPSNETKRYTVAANSNGEHLRGRSNASPLETRRHRRLVEERGDPHDLPLPLFKLLLAHRHVPLDARQHNHLEGIHLAL